MEPIEHAEAAPGENASFESWFDMQSLDAATGSSVARAQYKGCLKQGNARLIEQFAAGTPVPVLLRGRSWLVDQVLQRVWTHLMGDAGDALSLAAVGGYGRSELMPGSDIDLLILLPDEAAERYNRRIESLLTFLWDIGLEVGHSVRTIAECVSQSLADITVVTNLMEARLLAGSPELFWRMEEDTGPAHVWNSRDFFAAKCEEQKFRHHKFGDTAYKLEPNIKESPGGLRDIQVITWVANRYFGTDSLRELVDHEFLTRRELHLLIEGRDLLWNIRFALHALTGRGEDRLLFDYQRTLAEQFGYADDATRLGVEAFMKQYYRTIMELSRLTEMLLQLFHESILHPEGPGEPVPLNRRFQERNGFLETTGDQVFHRHPYALLEVFLLMAQNPRLQGVRAGTIRAIREHRHLINDDFRNDIRCRSLFMEILRQPQRITHELRRMNRYGILAAYLPAFERIVGLMQYDLFHIYTVDEHILFVVRNLRRFTVQNYALEFPLCSHVVATLPKPELLYLAALFHDIAKGRGGDHSELGGQDAYEFCIRHDLSDYDAALVTWLVQHHLIMSSTAQREDIDDPEVINRFARTVGDPARLDYLYTLTVADIRATNPDMWNTWKDALLKQLYYNTRKALHRGLQDPMERAEHIQQVQHLANELLGQRDIQTLRIWEQLGEEYFLRTPPEQVAHHTRLLREFATRGGNIVDIQPLASRGGTEIFIYAPGGENLFSRITAALDQLSLNVVDAGIITTADNFIMDTFHVLEVSGKPVEGATRIEEIRDALLARLDTTQADAWHVSRRAPRHYRHFPIKTHIEFKLDEIDNRTIMELITGDRPGLLSRIGRAFSECGINLQNAKIATLGSRAEDVYYITDRRNLPLTEPAQFECLEQAIHKYLENDPKTGIPL